MSQPTVILGINAFHGDASVAALVDGQFKVGVDEERFTRVKHWAGFPQRALNHCTSEVSSDGLSGVTAMAVSRNPKAYFLRKVRLALTHPQSLGRAFGRVRNIVQVDSLRAHAAKFFNTSPEKTPPLHSVEHHLAHVASAFYCSPFEEAMCLTVDGFGDFVSSMQAIGRGNKIEVLDRVHFPHSLGLFYTAITQFLGFGNYGDEYKVMGLTAYGEPTFADALRKIVFKTPDDSFALDLRYFRHLSEGVDMTWEDGEPKLGTVYTPELEKLLGPARKKDDPLEQRHKDLAASVQKVYEEHFFTLVRALQRKTKLKKLALAGGCAMNSLANGRLLEAVDLDDVYIQAAAGDGGTSLGAALYVNHAILDKPRGFVMDHAYWGPKYCENDIRAAITRGIPGSEGRDGTYGQFVIETSPDEEHLVKTTAAGIAAGDVVGWYQGRSEWGSRALGNRSILADPRRADIRDLLNLKIKRRESFRPFAPSILQERTSDWFTLSYPDPFMIKVYPIRPEKRPLIPAVTHVDGTGRLQTVSKTTNPRYWNLIKAFEDLTGVPIVLNTSFNENEPIVNTPTEALECFLRTKMDRIVMDRVVIRRVVQQH